MQIGCTQGGRSVRRTSRGSESEFPVAFAAGRRIFLASQTSNSKTPIHSLPVRPGKEHTMKFFRGVRAPLVVTALFLVPTLATAQDADKQKMIEIEKAFA